jgi:hypothetical protein
MNRHVNIKPRTAHSIAGAGSRSLCRAGIAMPAGIGGHYVLK